MPMMGRGDERGSARAHRVAVDFFTERPTGREADRPPRSARTATHRKVTKAVRIGAYMSEEDARKAMEAMSL